MDVSMYRIKPGIKWVCTDEDHFDRYSLTCRVLEVHDEREFNGDGDIEVEYQDGKRFVMKVRRFSLRHEPVDPGAYYSDLMPPKFEESLEEWLRLIAVISTNLKKDNK